MVLSMRRVEWSGVSVLWPVLRPVPLVASGHQLPAGGQWASAARRCDLWTLITHLPSSVDRSTPISKPNVTTDNSM
jgi:hypothetical protein